MCLPLSYNVTELEILIRDIFRNVFQTTTENIAEFIQGFGLHVFVGLQPANGFTVDPALLSELIGGDFFLFHGLPKAVKTNHTDTPFFLDKDYYGGYNLYY